MRTVASVKGLLYQRTHDSSHAVHGTCRAVPGTAWHVPCTHLDLCIFGGITAEPPRNPRLACSAGAVRGVVAIAYQLLELGNLHGVSRGGGRSGLVSRSERDRRGWRKNRETNAATGHAANSTGQGATPERKRPRPDGAESVHGGIRTHNLCLRRATLYPVELRGQQAQCSTGVARFAEGEIRTLGRCRNRTPTRVATRIATARPSRSARSRWRA